MVSISERQENVKPRRTYKDTARSIAENPGKTLKQIAKLVPMDYDLLRKHKQLAMKKNVLEYVSSRHYKFNNNVERYANDMEAENDDLKTSLRYLQRENKTLRAKVDEQAQTIATLREEKQSQADKALREENIELKRKLAEYESKQAQTTNKPVEDTSETYSTESWFDEAAFNRDSALIGKINGLFDAGQSKAAIELMASLPDYLQKEVRKMNSAHFR